MFFFSIATATAEFFSLSLHDALPILDCGGTGGCLPGSAEPQSVEVARGRRTDDANDCRSTIAIAADALGRDGRRAIVEDRKSTRLNSSHANISYAVFCLKKKKTKHQK